MGGRVRDMFDAVLISLATGDSGVRNGYDSMRRIHSARTTRELGEVLVTSLGKKPRRWGNRPVLVNDQHDRRQKLGTGMRKTHAAARYLGDIWHGLAAILRTHT